MISHNFGLVFMLSKLRTQLIILIMSFLLLIFGGFLISYNYINDHSAHEYSLDVIRSHRFMIQRLTWLSLADPENNSIATTQEGFKDVLESVENDGFQSLLGGRETHLSPEAAQALDSQYGDIAQLWSGYTDQLAIVISSSQDDPEKHEQYFLLVSQEREIINSIDEIFAYYEEFIKEQHERIEFLLIGFFALAVPLVFLGMFLLRDRLANPLEALVHSATLIKSGDLGHAVIAERNDEIGQLAISMEAMRKELLSYNQQLEKRIKERTHELSVVTRFSQEIARKMFVEEIVELTVQQAKELLNADEVYVCLASPGKNSWQMVADSLGLIVGEKPEQPASNVISSDQINEKSTVLGNGSGCHFLHSQGSKRCLSSTLQMGEQIIGEMCVQRDNDNPFNENEERAFSLLSNSAAIAIHNSQLVEIAKHQAIDSARITERQNLAAELHDELAQNLGVSKLQIGQLINSMDGGDSSKHRESLKKLYNNLEIANEQIRMVIGGLSSRPKNTQDVFDEELKSSLADFYELCDIPVDLAVQGKLWEEDSPPLVKRQLVLILREALVNVRKHSKATKVEVSISKDQDQVVLVVKDDGCGFELEQASGDHHFGLKIMHARAERSGGKLTIQSTPGEGTTLRACFPVAEQPVALINPGEGIPQ
jgi:two-component system nitrate/nitrite sensor histidine kinase NarX